MRSVNTNSWKYYQVFAIIYTYVHFKGHVNNITILYKILFHLKKSNPVVLKIRNNDVNYKLNKLKNLYFC